MTQEIDLYLRKSAITRQRERALTFRAQEERGRRWADENGYTVRKVWADNLSAYTDTVRPKFDKAIGALLADEVPALWCYAADRFSRKGLDPLSRSSTRGSGLSSIMNASTQPTRATVATSSTA